MCSMFIVIELFLYKFEVCLMNFLYLFLYYLILICEVFLMVCFVVTKFFFFILYLVLFEMILENLIDLDIFRRCFLIVL